MKKIVDGEFRYALFEPNGRSRSNKVVILYHGWGVAIDGLSDVAEEIKTEGYTVIVPEIIYHDTRSPLETPFEPKIMQTYFWKTIIESIDEFDGLVNAVEIDDKNIFLVGSSMGGFIANGIFARHPNLLGLVNMNGSGSFVLSEKIFRKLENRKDISVEEENLLRRYDPIGRRNCQSPILLIHGDSDTTVPIEGQRDYFRYLLQIENRKDVVFKIHKNINHQFTMDMVKELIVWLNKVSAEKGLI